MTKFLFLLALPLLGQVQTFSKITVTSSNCDDGRDNVSRHQPKRNVSGVEI